ncbi:MAG: TMEM165/GDT1 family protein [Thaumarchaeota archaeon]|nr:TMEM165/GDT1 family protein [Nitrososphaerota archaeon]
MDPPLLTAFAGIAAALFITELTDKDALLLLALAGREKASTVFLAGVSAFALTTALFVTAGSLITRLVPIAWVKFAGGTIMIAYALWEARGLVGERFVEREEREVEKKAAGWRVFVSMVGALVILDVAGDATEVLTIVFVAHYSNALLVFAGVCTGLILATGVETALGSRLGKLLTPARIRNVSVVVFLILGTFIILSAFT